MAGIGFRLQQLTTNGTYFQGAAAYLAAAVIFAGPWVTTVISLATLGVVSSRFMSLDASSLLFTSITYVFCASLILTGAPQMILARYVADRLYVDDLTVIAPAWTALLLGTMPILIGISFPFIIFAPFDLSYRLLLASLFLTVSLIWLVMVFLSAARSYSSITFGLIVGHAIGLAGATWLAPHYGLLGSLFGFTVGQIICLTLLASEVLLQFPTSRIVDFSFLRYVRRFWELALIGLFYYLGMWIDKFVYWYSPDGVVVGNLLHSYPKYDAMMLVAYLSTVIASATVLIHIETRFFRHYQSFYKGIGDDCSLAELVSIKKQLVQSVKDGFLAILKVQGIVAGLVMLLAEDIVGLLGFESAAPLLRIAVLAVSGQFLLLVAVMLLLYLDQRRATLVVAGLFVLANGILSLATLPLGQEFYGLGYLLATVAASLVAIAFLRDRLSRLEYLTFMLQPLGTEPREGLDSRQLTTGE